MTRTVEIYGLNKVVRINEEEVRAYGEYEEAVIADDGACVAYDDASNTWVQLWPSAPSDW